MWGGPGWEGLGGELGRVTALERHLFSVKDQGLVSAHPCEGTLMECVCVCECV